MVKPVWNNAQRVNHQNFAKKTHPCAKKNMVPKAILMKQVNAAHSKTTVNAARPMSYLSKIAHSTVKRPIHKNTTLKNSNIDQRVNTVSGKKNTARPKAVVNAVKENNFNDVKASACWVWKPKTKIQVSDGLGPQKKLIFLSNVQGNPQMDLQDQGVIDSGCSRHMTGNMSYLTDYEEIDRGYVAFGGNPKGGKITGKGTIKTGNLDFENVYFVRELKFNLFSVSQMCDKKNSVLFNDTECIVLSPNFKLIDESQVLLRVPRKNNMYSVDLKNIVPKGGLTCLFAKATSDESKLWHRRLGKVAQSLLFTWVFFLATKDETSGILKSFITGIENLVDHKGILRQFSVARTPQQNGIAERRNRTLIKAGRTMLADSKLPTTFWAEAVNTACYVQNRVLVVKPHNKTPYELFHGRTPTLNFMRPFGCPVTILNTIDHLGKFDGKADEGFFIGYSLNSKAFRILSTLNLLRNELDALESDKAEFSSNMYDIALKNVVSLKMECDCLAQKLYEQTEFVKCQEQLKNDTVCKEKASNVFQKEREQYFEIQDLMLQLQDKNIAINNVSRLYNSILLLLTLDAQSNMSGQIYLCCVILLNKYLGTVFVLANDQFSQFLDYGDLGSRKTSHDSKGFTSRGFSITSFSVGQFSDARFGGCIWKSTVLLESSGQTNLLTGNRGTALYIISSSEKQLHQHPICSLAKASQLKLAVLLRHRWTFSSQLRYINCFHRRWLTPLSQRGLSCLQSRNKVDSESFISAFDETKRCQRRSVAKGTPSRPLSCHTLFGPLYDEFFFNDGTSRVNKSSSPTDNSAPQDTHPLTNIHPTTIPSTPTHVNAEENNNDQAEFTNPFCTPVQEITESSSHNIGNSNVYTFNQPHDSKYRWTKDHPLTQRSLENHQAGQTRQQLATDLEMCRTFSFDSTYKSGGTRSTKPFGPRNVIKLKQNCASCTIHMGLWYPKGSGFELTAFLDADHAGCLDTRKSTSGGIQFLEAVRGVICKFAQVMWYDGGHASRLWLSTTTNYDCIATLSRHISNLMQPRAALSYQAYPYSGKMPTKIELTLEQSQQGVSNDVLSDLFCIHNDEWKSSPESSIIKQHAVGDLQRFYMYQLCVNWDIDKGPVNELRHSRKDSNYLFHFTVLPLRFELETLLGDFFESTDHRYSILYCKTRSHGTGGYIKMETVPPPYIGNFMPPTPDLSFDGLDEFVNKPVVENRKSDKEVSEIVRKNDDAPIIEEWMSDSEEENVSQPKTKKKTVKPSIAKIEFVKPKQQEKTTRKTVK
ncbi:ribonuclease H-like domain-containing protein [Tanacetum coccineum]|uniref:Ribonuclease H-like domain-containing protein n=1 Tax=Tanacetum coccineum TaxID=301880 RepID=A0ABQ4XE34_9ASTR